MLIERYQIIFVVEKFNPKSFRWFHSYTDEIIDIFAVPKDEWKGLDPGRIDEIDTDDLDPRFSYMIETWRHGNIDLSEIAEVVGYNQPEYFPYHQPDPPFPMNSWVVN